jgi:hypothetical protein
MSGMQRHGSPSPGPLSISEIHPQSSRSTSRHIVGHVACDRRSGHDRGVFNGALDEQFLAQPAPFQKTLRKPDMIDAFIVWANRIS